MQDLVGAGLKNVTEPDKLDRTTVTYPVFDKKRCIGCGRCCLSCRDSGHPLACAAGVACLKYYDDAKILDNVNASGKVLGEELEALKAKYEIVGDVRYIGLFSAIELVRDRETKAPLVEYGKDPAGIMKSIIGKLKEKGFMTYSHENMILICPPLIITPDQVKEEMKKADEVIAEINGIY